LNQKKTRKTIWVSAAAIIILVSGLFAFRYYNAYRYHVEKQTRFMMDTFVTIYAIGPGERVSDAVRAAFERMQAVNDKFSTQNPEGAVYAFNHENTPISDPEIVHVVEKALDIARKTDGAFDITIQPLIELWGFYGDHPALPDTGAVQACLKNTGYRFLHIRAGRLIKERPEIKIDLGGIAKGHAIAEAVAALKTHGISSALIDAGGDVYALGRRGEAPWTIGIRDPRGEGIIGTVEVEDLAVMGSGDYQRFFMKDGQRFHHIFDPKTGFPARGVQSTTLLYADPMLADAWNTAIFVLGEEKGLAMIEQMPGIEAMMVTSEGKVRYSSGLANALNMNANAKTLITRRQ